MAPIWVVFADICMIRPYGTPNQTDDAKQARKIWHPLVLSVNAHSNMNKTVLTTASDVDA